MTPATPYPLPVEAEDFLLWLRVERGRSQATLAAYRRDLAAHSAWLGRDARTLADVDEDVLIQYLRFLQRSGHASSTTARAMVAVRSLYRFMAAEGLRSDDPSRDVELPKVPRGLPKALTEHEVSELLAAVDGDDPLARRDRALLEVLYGTGARVSEVVGASLGDLDLSENTLRLFGKGRKERLVPLGRYARDALAQWLDPAGRGAVEPRRWASRDDSDAIFLNRRGGRLSRQGGWGVVKKYGSRVGLGAKLSPHTLRHCCATHMIEHGADIRTVQELLGHTSITTTQIYTKVSRDQLTAAYLAAHPRARG